jgi:uncharacterized protein YndB with AHSA1/START domain
MSLSVEARGETDLVLRRSFHAPRELVFRALTTPELLPRWYGARGWELVECSISLRVGGGYCFVSQGPDGSRMTQRGTYREIMPPERLVYTERFDDQSYPGDTLITQVLSELDGLTTLTSTVRYATREGRDRVLRYPMARGASEGYERLDAVLTELMEERETE